MTTAPAAVAAAPPFASLPLCPASVALLASQGLHTATPVQAAVIPLLTANSDVAADAATGSGKTLAFVLPLVERLRRAGREERLRANQVFALVLSPTRELAAQIAAVAAPFLAAAAPPPARSVLLVGGSDPAAAAADLATHGATLIVGTPGRTADAVERAGAALDWSRFDLLIIDEADRVLDNATFRAQVDAVVGRLPKQRRTGLFSATQTEAVSALARAGLRNAVRVKVGVAVAAGDRGGGGGGGPRVTPASLAVCAATLPVAAKPAALAAFLLAHAADRVIVYFSTCAAVDFYAAALPVLLKAGREAPARGGGGAPAPSPLPLFPLHGRMKQTARARSLAAFASCPAGGALLATDVAARGLDVPAVAWTLQYDAPSDADAFVHRVGRAARAGAAGAGLVLLAPHEAGLVDVVRGRGVPVDPAPPPAAPPSLADARALALLRAATAADRAVLDAGVAAFVATVRGYRDTALRGVVKVKETPLGELATTFGLHTLPRLKEVATAPPARLAGFEPSGVDVDAIPYRDRAREAARRARAARAAADAAARAEAAAARPPARAAPAPPQKKLPAAKRRALTSRRDEDDLNDDYALLRKLKKGKVSEADADAALLAVRGGGSDSDDGGDGGSDSDAAPARPPKKERSARSARGRGRRRGGGFVPARR